VRLRGLVVLLTIPLLGFMEPEDVKRRAEAVGAALCVSAGDAKKVPGLASVGPGTKQRLSELRTELTAGCSADVRNGDAPPPLGDGRATHHLLLRKDGRAILGLRLAHDPGRDVFRVVGFWSPDRIRLPEP
jgi:hypothetical protein